MEPRLPRVAIIGAGVAGLTACKALGDREIPHVCYEGSDDVGGNWYFKNPNGRSSAYRSLHIDSSRLALSFRDFPMPDGYPDFPHHTEVLRYLHAYVDQFELRKSIRFGKTVTHACRHHGGGWTLSLQDGSVDRFDALLVCNGHHWDPSWPEPMYPGEFDGQQIHSHDYIDPTEPLDLRGRKVLVVGIGNSAVDIVCELARKGVAEAVYISTRSGAYVLPKYVFGKPVDQLVMTIPWLPLGPQRRLGGWLQRLVSGKSEYYGLPTPNHRFLEAHPTVSSELLLRLGSGDAFAKPNVSRLDGRRVTFEDGSSAEVDAIIWATGYKISFPFFDADFISAPGNVLPLWKRTFKPDVDDLAFIGLAQPLPTLFPFCETQSKLVARWLAGEWALPSVESMTRDIQRDDAYYTGHLGKRPRHTIEVDLVVYEYDMRRKVIPAGLRRAKAGVSPLAGRAGAAPPLQAGSERPETRPPSARSIPGAS
jgi:cation diffusion facilitator CzcD-associated flavoprotein CzcO